MMIAIKDFEMPVSCLMCRKRKCLHIDGKVYQMCGLNEDGYLTESWFNSENLPKDHRAEHCPLREVEAIPKDQYEARLKADLVVMLEEIQLEIEENGIVDFEETYVDDGECIISVSECNRLIQQIIDKLKEENNAIDKKLFNVSHGLKYSVVARPYTDDMQVKEKIYTKDEVEAILKEMSTAIEEEREDCQKLSNCYERFAINAMAQRSQIVIEQKINELKENTDGDRYGLKYPVVARPYTDDMEVKEKFFTKADMAAMLEELKTEIKELKNEPACCHHYKRGVDWSSDIVQQKINSLKGEKK